MKKGINAWCFPGGYSLEETFALASALTYDGLELNMTESAEPSAHEAGLCIGMDAGRLQCIKKLSEEYKLPICSLSGALFWKYPFTDNDAAVREKAVAVAKEMLDAAAYLECGAILAVPGLVTGDVSYKTAYKRALQAFKELAPYAEAKKVVIGKRME
jgi:hexulose-6-phosphate isomerase